MIRYDLRRLFPRSAVVALCLVCLGLVYPAVNAQTVAASDAAFGRFMQTTVGAGQTSVSFGTGGVPLASPTQGTLSTNGNPYLSNTRTGSITNPSGNPVAVTGTARYGGAKLAPLLVKGLKVVPVLGSAFALYDIAREVGHDPIKNPDGSVTWRKVDPSVCTVAPCYLYTTRTPTDTAAFSPYLSSKSSACARAMQMQRDRNVSTGFSWRNPIVLISDSGSSCVFRDSPASYIVFDWTYYTQTTSPSQPVYLPSTEQEFIDAVALKSGWPSSSALSRAVADAAQLTGDQLSPDSVVVTGPATSTGPAKTTVHADGSRTVTTPVHNHSYVNNVVTTTTTTTINNYNSSNVLTSTSTETSTPETSKSLCELDPDSVACQRLDSPETEVPKSTKNLTYTPEDLGLGSGSCPAPIPVNTSRGNWSIDLAPYCAATETYVRPMVILVAMFLAYLIMTGYRFGGD